MLWYFASEHPTALIISPRLPAQVGKCVGSFVRAEGNLVSAERDHKRYENSA